MADLTEHFSIGNLVQRGVSGTILGFSMKDSDGDLHQFKYLDDFDIKIPVAKLAAGNLSLTRCTLESWSPWEEETPETTDQMKSYFNLKELDMKLALDSDTQVYMLSGTVPTKDMINPKMECALVGSNDIDVEETAAGLNEYINIKKNGVETDGVAVAQVFFTKLERVNEVFVSSMKNKALELRLTDVKADSTIIDVAFGKLTTTADAKTALTKIHTYEDCSAVITPEAQGDDETISLSAKAILEFASELRVTFDPEVKILENAREVKISCPTLEVISHFPIAQTARLTVNDETYVKIDSSSTGLASVAVATVAVIASVFAFLG